MTYLKRIFCKIRHFYEVFLPTIAFIILFVTFVWSVFNRYVLNRPPIWATEVQAAAYTWSVLLSATYIRRLNRHVSFTMIYDILNLKWQRVMRIFGNSVIGITYTLLLGPTVKYIVKLKTTSMSLAVPLKFYFAPIIILVASVLVYSLHDIYIDVLEIIQERKQKPKINGAN